MSFLNDIAGDMVYPLLPVFLASIGAGAASLGALEGIAEAVAALVKWLSGAQSDRMPRRKPLVVAGYAVAALVRPLLRFAYAPWQVIAARAIDRAASGLRAAPRDALLVENVPADRRAAAFAFHRMMDNLGAVVGPLVAFGLARGGLDVRTIFALAIVPGVLAVFTVAYGVEERAREVSSKASVIARRAPLPSRARLYLGILAVFTLGASADSFLLFHLLARGLDPALVPLVWLSLNLSKALTNVPGGKLSDRIGHRRALVIAWLLYAVIYALLPLARELWIAWGLILVYGAYYGLSEGGAKAVLAEMIPKEARGRGYGALNAITGAAILPANAIFGALYEKSPRCAFWAGAGFAGLAALLLAISVALERATEAD